MSLFNHVVSKSIMFVPGPIVGIFARKYIAGNTLDHAVQTTKKLNQEGIKSTIDVLGEFISTKGEALWFKNQALEVLKTIHRTGIDANLSIKPTQMGLNLDQDFAYANIEEIVAYAKSINNFVRIDMEDISCTTKTINFYHRLRQAYAPHVGTVLQSYLRRTVRDIQDLNSAPMNIRLCKGIYNEPREHAYKHPDVINRNYVLALEKLFEQKAYVGIATHDPILIFEATRLIEKYDLKPSAYEFQMLLGVDEQLRHILTAQGHKLRIYVPYGASWLPYAKRRLKENPDIARHALRQMLGLKAHR
ncbi:MAG: proline dehydrogenase family protein [Desulfovermiculus sp.]|nr:proline dehydrogenase family protein [Desulfovermiculus sp.]